MKITLSFTDTEQDIEEQEMRINDAIQTIANSSDKIYLFFYSCKKSKKEGIFADEHPYFLTTRFLPEIRNALLDYEFTENIEINIFCFENYFEAFTYCLDLKDGRE